MSRCEWIAAGGVGVQDPVPAWHLAPRRAHPNEVRRARTDPQAADLYARVRELVKATIPVLKEHGVALTTYFYQRMFRHNPELKNIFNQSHNETGKQPVALAMAVLAYAENIDDPSVLAPVITLIANKHASVG